MLEQLGAIFNCRFTQPKLIDSYKCLSSSSLKMSIKLFLNLPQKTDIPRLVAEVALEVLLLYPFGTSSSVSGF